MYCTKCGAMLDDSAVICPRCGCATQNYRPGYNPRQPVRTCSPKSRLAAILLCVFLGGLGIHRFYVGKIGTRPHLAVHRRLLRHWLAHRYYPHRLRSFSDSAGLLVLDWGV